MIFRQLRAKARSGWRTAWSVDRAHPESIITEYYLLDFIFLVHLQISWPNFSWTLLRARKERQIASQASAGYLLIYKLPADHPQSAAGARSESFGEITEPPARVREGCVPHDCKQDDFSFGPLRSQHILDIPPLWPSINLEMIHFF